RFQRVRQKSFQRFPRDRFEEEIDVRRRCLVAEGGELTALQQKKVFLFLPIQIARKHHVRVEIPDVNIRSWPQLSMQIDVLPEQSLQTLRAQSMQFSALKNQTYVHEPPPATVKQPKRQK